MKHFFFAILFLIVGCQEGPRGAPGYNGVPGIPGVPGTPSEPGMQVSTGAVLYDGNEKKIGPYLQIFTVPIVLLSDQSLLPISFETGKIGAGLVTFPDPAGFGNSVACFYESLDCSGRCVVFGRPLKNMIYFGANKLYRGTGAEIDQGPTQINSYTQTDGSCSPLESRLQSAFEIQEYTLPESITLPLKTPLMVAE